ncbi:helix-turn-helix transcriptional regulator [Halostreptopolyspora alba]|uniref:XRE family transcriptional regulator n=1 Tax=Halostreptopolyspora alba TaxID=2487137 RepID=A0A3N0E6H2_9ACTN|nr:XRE family transcriptional regulator [Nocardiopsaceae bacterium YIM 96095]
MVDESPAAKRRRREQLRDFLRTRRARLTPDDVGMVTAGRRRTPGLRREEVALLAGVGVSWYTWLEQGRDINASADVLDAVGRALRLSDPERAHLYLLAGLNPPRPEEPRDTRVTPELGRLLDAWEPRPALLRDEHWNLLAVNGPAREVFGYRDTDHNCLVTFFTSARYRDAHIHWEAVAPAVVAAFRADAARSPDDEEFQRLVADLGAVSPEFVELWARHEVAEPEQAVKAVRHPELGDLVFDMTPLAVVDHPGWQLELYNPQPDTGTVDRLARMEHLRLTSPG